MGIARDCVLYILRLVLLFVFSSTCHDCSTIHFVFVFHPTTDKGMVADGGLVGLGYSVKSFPNCLIRECLRAGL